MEFDTSKLRGRIIEVCGTVGAFIEKVSAGSSKVYDYLNGKSVLSQSDIMEWCEVLDIKPKDITSFFFTPRA